MIEVHFNGLNYIINIYFPENDTQQQHGSVNDLLINILSKLIQIDLKYFN